MPDVATVIVNYRTAGMVVDCLRSMADPGERLGPVVVVDNASGDGSADRIAAAVRAEGWGDWVTLLALESNGGFAAGNNAGLRHVLGQPELPEFVLLLNPDTVARAGAVAALVRFLRNRPAVGIAGSRLEDPDGRPQRSACRFPTLLGELEGGLRFGPVTRLLRRWTVAPPTQDEPHPTDWVVGASMMVRRSVIEQIGPLDDGFFLYFEEVDYCRRAREAGWECWYVPASRVVHYVGASTGAAHARRTASRVPTYWFESRRRYFRRHHGRAYAFATDVLWATGYALWRLRRRFQGKRDDDPPGLLADFIRHNFYPARVARRQAVR